MLPSSQISAGKSEMPGGDEEWDENEDEDEWRMPRHTRKIDYGEDQSPCAQARH